MTGLAALGLFCATATVLAGAVLLGACIQERRRRDADDITPPEDQP